MKLYLFILFLFLFFSVKCQSTEYFSSHQKIVVADFKVTNVSISNPTYIAYQTTKSLEYSYFYMSDARRVYPENLKKTWSKDYKIFQFSKHIINCTDSRGNLVSFTFDEFSVEPTMTMIIKSGNSVAKKIVYYLD